MDTKRRWIAFIFVIMLLADFPSLIFANDFEEPVLSLRGLKGICSAGVLIEYHPNYPWPRWLNKLNDELNKEVASQLTGAGITVYDQKLTGECTYDRKPFLWITVDVLNESHKDLVPYYQYFCKAHVRLCQMMYLEAKSNARRFLGCTYQDESWSGPSFHSIPEDEPEFIRRFVRDTVDGFIKDYWSVNPKQEVILRGIRYRIFDSYWSDYLYLGKFGKFDQGPLQKANARFLVIDFSITNMEKEATEKHLAPVFRLTDEQGSEYESVKPDTPVETLISKLLTQPMDSNVEINGKLIFDVPPGRRYELRISSPKPAEVSTAPAEVSGESFSFDLTPLPKPRCKVGMIGISLNEDGGIAGVIHGGPAFESGLKAGDKIIKVNGQPVAAGGITIRHKIAGDAGTTVELTVLRQDKELLFKIDRKILGIN